MAAGPKMAVRKEPYVSFDNLREGKEKGWLRG